MFKIDGTIGRAFQNLFKTEQAKPAGPPTGTPLEPSFSQDRLKLSAEQRIATPPKTDGMSDEEIGLQKQDLLPHNYSELKAAAARDGVEAAMAIARAGKRGPFSDEYGDPGAMLESARKFANHPELLRMYKDLKPGDVLLYTFNKEDDVISNLTKGPFIHAMLCTASGPPPELIEAVGITGSADDPTTNRVRRTSLARFGNDNATFRIVRPTDGLSEVQAKQAVEKAIHYAEGQLGKPYDYTFTDINQGTGLTDAYYCSELAYLAYASHKGANLNIPLEKSPERDSLLMAINSVVDTLEPKNKAELMDKAMKLSKQNPKPTTADLVGFLVDEILTKCTATEDISKSPEDRGRLKKSLQKLFEGDGFPGFSQALDNYRKSEAEGDFKTPLIGWERKQLAKLSVGKGLAFDLARLFSSSGVNYAEAAKTAKDLAGAILPHAETISAYLYGAQDDRTKAVAKLLDGLDWIKDHAPDLPVVGDLGLGKLPARARPEVKTDFVSPTDLAWAKLEHHDYNVKPGHPVDKVAYERKEVTVS